MNKVEGVSRGNKLGSNIHVGLGYISVPFGVDRDNFVKSCYRKERVFLILDQGGTMVRDCYIDSKVLQEIKFPEDYKSLGSQVIFVLPKFNKVPVVIASVARSRERIISNEEQFTIYKELNDGFLSIVGTGEGKILINLNSSSASELKINMVGEDSNLEINNDGNTSINAKSDINITSSSKVVKQYLNDSGEVEKSLTLDENGFKYEDDKGNKFFIDYENDTINHNDGGQPIPLGNNLKEELNKLNDKFNSFLTSFLAATPVPGDGGAGLQVAVTAATLTDPDADFDEINSSKSFID